MNDAISKEFGEHTPRAIVLDDDENMRKSLERRLRRDGFHVETFGEISGFLTSWKPGLADVILADWDLSANEKGDGVLFQVRQLDWSVPFVLISGKLGEDEKRLAVFGRLLEGGAAKFVQRGKDGMEKASAAAQSLLLRRDQALQKIVLSYRKAALAGAVVRTTSGEVSALDMLAEAVRTEESSHDLDRPIAEAIRERKGR